MCRTVEAFDKLFRSLLTQFTKFFPWFSHMNMCTNILHEIILIYYFISWLFFFCLTSQVIVTFINFIKSQIYHYYLLYATDVANNTCRIEFLIQKSMYTPQKLKFILEVYQLMSIWISLEVNIFNLNFLSSY